MLAAETPQLLARCMLTLYDALRPAVLKRILTERWNFMDIDIVPGGLAVLDPVRASRCFCVSIYCARAIRIVSSASG